MDKKNKVRSRSRLFLKVYINYAIMLTVLAVLVGLIFMNLYKTKTMDNYKYKLQNQATSIAGQLSEFIINGEEDNYIEDLDTLGKLDPDTPDIWTISNPNAVHP
ncbi:hypothetical protein Ana3638_01730 [Anaerocolumna sedimenticola]|uniref:Two-component sensor histidine kinase n=1 Tax=Anaerocolumna sedimenticola TaxID=2696063 RepID=A0A6P1TI04_9FIRM|nr:hypothetical protein [Anaerocolumna sedimenticola]QHQ59671.1 hypothetical protein Ana3638_01730 [Anaerocolumna sedimenticola]